MLLLLLNYVVLRALWKIDLISTLVNKSLYYYYWKELEKTILIIPNTQNCPKSTYRVLAIRWRLLFIEHFRHYRYVFYHRRALERWTYLHIPPRKGELGNQLFHRRVISMVVSLGNAEGLCMLLFHTHTNAHLALTPRCNL